MLLKFEKGLRGGICQAIQRHAKVNIQIIIVKIPYHHI